MQREYMAAFGPVPSFLVNSRGRQSDPDRRLVLGRACALASILLISLAIERAEASITTGRFSFGGYISRENLSNTGDSASSNDFETLSSRVFLNIRKLGNFDFTADLRDKHDFFEKLAAERRSLTGGNDFQARELNLKYPNRERSFYGSFGRFALPDAGSVYVDGAELGWRFGGEQHSGSTAGYHLGAFGGHNPKRPETSYLRNDTPDVTYGAYFTTFSAEAGSPRFFNASHAFVTNSVDGFTDRQYIYSNILFQRGASSRVISNIYIDFVPRAYIQNGNLLVQQGFSENLDGSVQFSAVDAIAYSRSRNVLETLPSSPYEDVALRARYATARRSQWLSELRFGKRDYDGKFRQEAKFGYHAGDLDGSRVDFTAYAGYHQEFITQGPEASLEVFYYSRAWEYGFNLQSSVENRLDADASLPSVLHPVVTELSISNVASNVLFTTFSLEYAQNETVQIFSMFFKLTYRIGPLDLAPMRERAPRLGNL